LPSIFGEVTSDSILTEVVDTHEDILGLCENNSNDGTEVLSDINAHDFSDRLTEDEDVCQLSPDIIDCDDFEDPEGFYLDNELQEHTDDVPDFDELDYTEYNMIPIIIEQADEVVATHDKLVKLGKIPKDGTFYKYVNDETRDN